MEHKNVTSCSLAEQNMLVETNDFAENGSMFAFCGGAAIGHVADAFKSVDMATPLLVTSMLPMELTI